MAGIFDDVQLGWKDTDYVIPANRVLRAIAAIEDVIELHELSGYIQGQKISFAKISMAYAAVLRVAGVDVSDDEVYEAMVKSAGTSNNLYIAVAGLMEMVMPKSEKTATAGDDSKKKSADAKRSSPKRTKPSSAPAS